MGASSDKIMETQLIISDGFDHQSEEECDDFGPHRSHLLLCCKHHRDCNIARTSSGTVLGGRQALGSCEKSTKPSVASMIGKVSHKQVDCEALFQCRELNQNLDAKIAPLCPSCRKVALCERARCPFHSSSDSCNVAKPIKITR